MSIALAARSLFERSTVAKHQMHHISETAQDIAEGRSSDASVADNLAQLASYIRSSIVHAGTDLKLAAPFAQHADALDGVAALATDPAFTQLDQGSLALLNTIDDDAYDALLRFRDTSFAALEMELRTTGVSLQSSLVMETLGNAATIAAANSGPSGPANSLIAAVRPTLSR